MPDEAAHALHSTLRQLDTGLSSSASGAPPPALSCEGLTHAVRSLLCSQRLLQQSNDHSSSMLTEREECDRPHRHSSHDTRELNLGLDSACWRKACALPPPQHKSVLCPVGRGEDPAQHAEDAISACSGNHDAKQCESSAAASACCSAAQYAAESPSARLCGGEGSRAEGSGFDFFNTSPSKGRMASMPERRHAAACRQILVTGKVPERTGPQRRLF